MSFFNKPKDLGEYSKSEVIVLRFILNHLLVRDDVAEQHFAYREVLPGKPRTSACTSGDPGYRYYQVDLDMVPDSPYSKGCVLLRMAIIAENGKRIRIGVDGYCFCEPGEIYHRNLHEMNYIPVE